MENKPRKKVLVIRFSAIGDIVLSTPVFKTLYDAGYEVHWLTKSKYAFVLKNFDYIHHTHQFPLSKSELDLLKSEDFDYVIDLQNNFKSLKVKLKLKKPTFSVRKLNFQKLLLVRLGWDLLKSDRPMVKRYLETLRALNLNTPINEHIIYPQKEVQLPKEKYISWVLGATYLGKKIDASIIQNTIQNNPEQHFVFLGGKEEVGTANQLSQALTNTTNLCGQTRLEEAAYLMEHSQIVISNDTGLMHIAASTKTPIITLWGCTSPLLGMGAHYPKGGLINIEPHGRKRRPCSKLGNHCKYKEICSSKIESDQITKAIKQLCEQ